MPHRRPSMGLVHSNKPPFGPRTSRWFWSTQQQYCIWNSESDVRQSANEPVEILPALRPSQLQKQNQRTAAITMRHSRWNSFACAHLQTLLLSNSDVDEKITCDAINSRMLFFCEQQILSKKNFAVSPSVLLYWKKVRVSWVVQEKNVRRAWNRASMQTMPKNQEHHWISEFRGRTWDEKKRQVWQARWSRDSEFAASHGVGQCAHKSL